MLSVNLPCSDMDVNLRHIVTLGSGDAVADMALYFSL